MQSVFKIIENDANFFPTQDHFFKLNNVWVVFVAAQSFVIRNFSDDIIRNSFTVEPNRFQTDELVCTIIACLVVATFKGEWLEFCVSIHPAELSCSCPRQPLTRDQQSNLSCTIRVPEYSYYSGVAANLNPLNIQTLRACTTHRGLMAQDYSLHQAFKLHTLCYLKLFGCPWNAGGRSLPPRAVMATDTRALWLGLPVTQ